MPHLAVSVEPLERRDLFSKTISFERFFPVHYGLEWKYITEDRGTVYARFSDIRRRNGRGTFVITETDKHGATENTTYVVDETAVRVSKVTEANRRGKVTETTTFDPPILYAPRKMRVGKDYTASSRVLIRDHKGRRGQGTIKVTVNAFLGFNGASPFSLRGIPLRTTTVLDVTSPDGVRLETTSWEGARFGECTGFENSVSDVQYAITRDGDSDVGVTTVGKYANEFYHPWDSVYCPEKIV